MSLGMTFDVLWRMVVAGILFGLWPILAKYSGVAGMFPMIVVNSTAVTIVVAAYVFTMHTQSNVPATLPTYLWMLSAGLCVGFGILAFSGGLDLAIKESPHGMYVPYLVMIIVQVAVPLLFHALFNGGTLNAVNILGLASAPLVIWAISYRPAIP